MRHSKHSTTILGFCALAGCASELSGDDIVKKINEEASAKINGSAVSLPGYYTKNETDTALAGYYTATETDAALLDYYTKTETDGGFAALIAADTTLSVGTGGEFVDLPAALASLARKIILPGATVTIALANGTYTHTAPIIVSHANGDRLRIVGNVANPAAVVLQFNGTTGVVVQWGGVLGGLNGLTIQGNDTAAAYGVHVTGSSAALIGPALTVSHFGYAIMVTGTSTLDASGVIARNNSGCGFTALTNSVLITNGSQAIDNAVCGFLAMSGATLSAADAIGTGNVGHGIAVWQMAFVNVSGFKACANGADFNVTPAAMAADGGLLYDQTPGCRQVTCDVACP